MVWCYRDLPAAFGNPLHIVTRIFTQTDILPVYLEPLPVYSPPVASLRQLYRYRSIIQGVWAQKPAITPGRENTHIRGPWPVPYCRFLSPLTRKNMAFHPEPRGSEKLFYKSTTTRRSTTADVRLTGSMHLFTKSAVFIKYYLSEKIFKPYSG